MAKAIAAAGSDDNEPSRKAGKVAALAIRAANWLVYRKEIAKNILAKVGAAVVGSDGKVYTVMESARRKLAKLVEQHDDCEMPGSLTFTIDEWRSIPPHPIQRSTEKRAKKCEEKFYRVRLAHKTVYMCVQANGDIYKLEGHTRTYNWDNGLTPAAEVPETLHVVVHIVPDDKAALSEYHTFDDATQVKVGSDQLYSAYQANNLSVSSDFLRRGVGVVDALREAFLVLAANNLISDSMLRRATHTLNLGKTQRPLLEECVKRFKAALKALDGLDAITSAFKGAVTQAFLLAYTKYAALGDASSEERMLEFFQLFRAKKGTRLNGKFDAVENFRAITEEPSGGHSHRKNKLPRLLGAIERYMENGANKMYAHDGIVNMAVYFTSRTALSKGNGSRKKGA